MHYLLFLPDCDAPQIADRTRRDGIGHLLDWNTANQPQNVDVVPNVNGPDNKTGTMLAWTSPTNPHFHYAPGEQTWLPSRIKGEAGTPLYQIGIWNNKPPTQSELRRNYTQRGPLVKLGAEQWILPTPDTVDARAVYADDGSMRWEVTRQFSWMCDEAKVLQAKYMEESGVRMFVYQVDPTEQINWLLKLLQINYRLLPELAVYLDLWTGRDHILDTFLGTLGMVRKAATNG